VVPAAVEALPAAQIVSVSVGDVKLRERDTETRAVFVLRLSEPADTTVLVKYASKNGTAVAPADYVAASGVAKFRAGQTSLPITLRVAGERTYEDDEIFFLGIISTSANAQIDDPEGAATLVNNDPQPRIRITDAATSETAGRARFQIKLTNPSELPITLRWQTRDLTAKAGTDYVRASGEVTFRPGTTSLPITLRVLRDAKQEPREQFAVVLTAPYNATIADAKAVATVAASR